MLREWGREGHFRLVGLAHFGGRGLPVESLGQREFRMWKPSECPLCAAGAPLEDLVTT